jgi:hypothetical protein
MQPVSYFVLQSSIVRGIPAQQEGKSALCWRTEAQYEHGNSKRPGFHPRATGHRTPVKSRRLAGTDIPDWRLGIGKKRISGSVTLLFSPQQSRGSPFVAVMRATNNWCSVPRITSISIAGDLGSPELEMLSLKARIPLIELFPSEQFQNYITNEFRAVQKITFP